MEYALVTGGSRGIGKAICLKLAQDGLNVIVNYATDYFGAEDTRKKAEAMGVEACVACFDVTSAAEVQRAVDKWETDHPGDYISVLVNNAGVRTDKLFMLMDETQWDKVVDTSLKGFFLVTRSVLKNMYARKYGRILSITSVSGQKGLPGQTNYSAAKAALIGASKALAQEVGGKGITVNCISPGYIKTDMTLGLDEEKLKKQIPVGRFGSTDEVANLAAFLASRESGYITGEVISINGGLYT